MATDELGTLARLNSLRAEVLDLKIVLFHGRIVGSACANMIAFSYTPPQGQANYPIYGSDGLVVRQGYTVQVLEEVGLRSDRK